MNPRCILIVGFLIKEIERERERERENSYKAHSFVSLIGHYVPQLAQLITQSNVKFNLKGIAVSQT